MGVSLPPALPHGSGHVPRSAGERMTGQQASRPAGQQARAAAAALRSLRCADAVQRVRAGRRSRRSHRARSRDQLPGAVRSARGAARPRRARARAGTADRGSAAIAIASACAPRARRWTASSTPPKRRSCSGDRSAAGGTSSPACASMRGRSRRIPGRRSASRAWRRSSSTCRRPPSSARRATSPARIEAEYEMLLTNRLDPAAARRAQPVREGRSGSRHRRRPQHRRSRLSRALRNQAGAGALCGRGLAPEAVRHRRRRARPGRGRRRLAPRRRPPLVDLNRKPLNLEPAFDI